MMKKTLSLLVALSLLMSLGLPALAGEKQTINLWSFTDEVPTMVEKYLEFNPDFAAKYDVKVTIIATTDGAYQPALDQALAAGGADAPDIYAAEAAFVLKYTQGDASSPSTPWTSAPTRRETWWPLVIRPPAAPSSTGVPSPRRCLARTIRPRLAPGSAPAGTSSLKRPLS